MHVCIIRHGGQRPAASFPATARPMYTYKQRGCVGDGSRTTEIAVVGDVVLIGLEGINGKNPRER